MSDRSQWKMLHLLYGTRRPSLSIDELANAGIDCYYDTIMMLAATGLVHKQGSQYELAQQAGFMASEFIVAHRRWPGADMRVDYPQAFVIMPFSQPWSDAVLKEFIEPAVLDGGFTAVRGDQIIRTGDLTKNILAELLTCGLAVADVTAPNPNVFYEVGLCHALGKDVLLLKQQGAALPADFGGAHYYEYDPGDLPRHKVALEDMIRRWGAEHHSHEIKALS